MPFSTRAKEDLARLFSSKKCCKVAELSAILHINGVLHLEVSQRFSFQIITENAPLARKIIKLLSSLFGLKAEVITKKSFLKKRNQYQIKIPFQPRLYQSLNELGILNDSFELKFGILERLVWNNCCAFSFLRGAFLAAGFITDPRKGYHLEIALNNFQLSQDLFILFERFNLNPKKMMRKGKIIIYLKDSQKIKEFLAMIGASQSLFQLEDINIYREIKNKINRLVNCETANLKKISQASYNQVKDIKILIKEIGLASLSAPLREIAQLRMQFPYASFRELGELASPPITRSAVYNRFRRIHKLAKLWEGSDEVGNKSWN